MGLTFGVFMSVYRTKYSRFIMHAFRANDIQRQIHENIGATINQITNKDLKAFRVKLPPEEERNAIAAVLSDMDAELEALEQRLAKTRPQAGHDAGTIDRKDAPGMSTVGQTETKTQARVVRLSATRWATTTWAIGKSVKTTPASKRTCCLPGSRSRAWTTH